MAALPIQIPLAAGPQPDWGVIGNSFDALAQQAPRMPNAVPNNAQMVAINNILVNIQNRLTGIENAVANVQNTVETIQNEVALQPMRTANASASIDAPLVYPPGMAGNVLAQLPPTKRGAITITGVAAQQALVLFGIQPLQGANAEQLRAQFHRYIGV